MIERIHFSSPLLKEFNNEGFFLADMHYHSKYSDTFTTPRSIVKLAAKRGVGVAITDHNHIQGCLDALKENRKHKVNIIPGIEVSTKQGPHLLAYFYSVGDLKKFYEDCIEGQKGKNPYMALKTTAEEVAECAKENNGIVSVAHPRAISTWDIQRKVNKGEIDSNILKSIDCAEVICGLILRKMNIRAVRWACERKMAITGGSDGHTLIRLGSVVTYSKSDDINSFLDSIIKKKNFVAGTETKMLPRAYSYSKAITKHSRYVGPSIRVHYRLGFRDSFRNIREKITNGKNRILRR